MTLGGIDIGTTGCKISVFSHKGELLCTVYREYKMSRRDGEHEFYAEDILHAVMDVFREAVHKVPKLDAVAVTSFGESFVLLDENNRCLVPSMLYTDPRGKRECEELVEKVGRNNISEITGIDPHEQFSLPKLMWIRAHHKKNFEKAVKVFLMQDYIVYMLSGVRQIDYSLASRTMGLDIRSLDWSRTMFAAAEIPASLFSTPVPSGTSAGSLKQEIAAEFNIDYRPLIVSGCHDQTAATLGAGVLDESFAMNGAGTVECISAIFRGIPDSQDIYRKGYAIVPYVIPGYYATYAIVFTSGALTNWFIEKMCGQAVADAEGESIFSALEELMKEKPTGVFVLPHFAGAYTPYMDSDSKGAFVGLSIEHDTGDLYKAVLEGISYEMRINKEELRELGIDIHRLRATGGGARSSAWLQIKADILKCPVERLGTSEAGTAGSAMLAGVASGAFEDLKSACDIFVHPEQTFMPDEHKTELYDVLFQKYRKVYEALTEVRKG